MGAVIAAILGLIGPLIGDLLKRWLERLLNKTAAAMEAEGVKFKAGPDGDQAASKELLTRAYESVPRLRIFRRALLRGMIDDIPPAVASGAKKLPAAVANELRAIAARDE